MSWLPRMIYGDNIRKSREIVFKGYDHNLASGDGTLWDMENMSSDLYPLLSPRSRRYLVRTLQKPYGFYAKDGLYWVDGTGFYKDGILKGTVTEGKKQIVAVGSRVLIFPDKVYYDDATGAFANMEATFTGAVTMQDGIYAGESAKANTIFAASANFEELFKAGDAVTISGCVNNPKNNTTIIIREVAGHYLRFYENSFTIGTTGAEASVTVKREVPDLDYVLENENRLWGVKGDRVYASALGDPLNFNVFDGLSTDSFQVDVLSAGDFTGAVSFRGYPCFFKEENVYKAYGDKPSNFQLLGAASLGVEKASGNSFGIAGEVLFYLSRAGVVAYTGGIPQSIAGAFGTDRYRNAVGGSDGVKYYVSMEDLAGKRSLFVYDTAVNLWHREDDLSALAFGYHNGLYCLDTDGRLWLFGDATEIPLEAKREELIESFAEFGDFTENDPNKKGVTKLQIRAELEAGATLQIQMQFDSSGEWETVKEIFAGVKRSYYIPIIPRRCDHFRIKLNGKGDWRLYSLVRESYSGSEY